MTNIFARDYERYEGVRPINIHLLRLLFLLMFLFVGFDSWSYIARNYGAWKTPMQAAAACMFAAYSLLSILGVFRPLKMLPIILFMIVYKSFWLAFAAYPLWSTGQLAGTPFEAMARVFIWMPVAIVITPWRYVVDHYVLGRAPQKSLRNTTLATNPS